jgi:signal transduction histidine kinase
VQTEFENIKHLSKALFSRNKSTSITAKDLPNKFQFACEAKMICCNDEVMDESDALHSQQLFEVILRPYLYEDQLFVLFLVRDVTLFNQVSVLQKVNENKSLMLAQVAHEFRNPLNVIICFAANLIDQLGPTNPITSEYL